ncbi:unnamed protein product [Trichogramma brassicae]|uniref:SOCS box domain-containing protein n=1 Tax=Trichogramma brassicae TaxID=86971 RepID=A0A6H5IZS3_9HYME|nr:unnamed protein product [Trichogramma brassicae]
MFFEVSDELNRPVQVNARDKSGWSPLHWALYGYCSNKMVELLLRRGSDPNLAMQLEGWTPLHIICQIYWGAEMAKTFFKINDELNQQVRLDARDEQGCTALELAVATFKPDVVDVLLDTRGADLSGFVFPTNGYIRRPARSVPGESPYNIKLRIASGALVVVENMQTRGYELNRSDALTIMETFDRFGLFDPFDKPVKFGRYPKSAFWFYEEEFATEEKKLMMNPSLSLYELIRLRPEAAAKRITFKDYHEFACSNKIVVAVCIISVAMQMMRRRCCCCYSCRTREAAANCTMPRQIFHTNYNNIRERSREHVYDTHRSAIDHCRAPTESVFCAASGTRRAKQRVESASQAEERDVQYSTHYHTYIHTHITARRLLGLPSYSSSSSSVVSRRFMPSSRDALQRRDKNLLPRARVDPERNCYVWFLRCIRRARNRRERRSDRPVHDGIHTHISSSSSRGPPFAEARYNAPGASIQYVIPMHGLYLANTHKHEPEKGDINQRRRRRRTLANWRWHRHTVRAKGKTRLQLSSVHRSHSIHFGTFRGESLGRAGLHALARGLRYRPSGPGAKVHGRQQRSTASRQGDRRLSCHALVGVLAAVARSRSVQASGLRRATAAPRPSQSEPRGRPRGRAGGATPLHALARTCVLESAGGIYFNDARRPAAGIIDALLEAGANIEARDRRGLSPLGVAVARYDTGLVRALLDRGADLAALDEDGWFRSAARDDFSAHELRCYPLTLDIVETMKLLKSAGREISHETRHRMLKYWMKIREHDTDHLIPDHSAHEALSYSRIVENLSTLNEYGFYIRPESMNHLRQFRETTREKMPRTYAEWIDIPDASRHQWFTNNLKIEVETLKGIEVNDDISLYRLCQMNYRRSYSIFEKMKDWRVPSLDDDEIRFLRQIVKRHLGNILIRGHLKLFAAELFASDPRCRLDLPYDVCYLIAEIFSDD